MLHLNPFAWFWAYVPRPAVFPPGPRLAPGAPIHISSHNTDPGLVLRTGANSVTITGVAEGPRLVGDIYTYEFGRGIGFSLDSDRAPTVDIFGDTNFTAKNRRSFSYSTGAKQTALAIAQSLAGKVNAAFEFRATVRAIPGGATIDFERR